jgi:transglutaminase-like putative cysteine protease
MDSFAYRREERFLPGPISQFYHPYPADRIERTMVQVDGAELELRLDREEGGATQVLIEREARILAADQVLSLDAWRRYYRVIYRDNVERLDEFSTLLLELLNEKTPRRRAEVILAWIQDFHYYRTGTLADLTSPLTCLATGAGDCDSRALLYVTFLHRLGIDAILLVSTEYQHSAVAVDVPGDGARLTIGDKSYLFAEVTDQVALGLVDRTMADPAGWIPIPLGPAP